MPYVCDESRYAHVLALIPRNTDPFVPVLSTMVEALGRSLDQNCRQIDVRSTSG
jgi:hypothetical protein